jgi:hypothetical protein
MRGESREHVIMIPGRREYTIGNYKVFKYGSPTLALKYDYKNTPSK